MSSSLYQDQKTETTTLTLYRDGKHGPLKLASLDEPTYFNKFQNVCTKEPVTIDVSPLLSVSDEHRTSLFQAVVDVGCPLRFRVGNKDESSLLTAILHLEPKDDIDERERWRKASVEAAAMFHSDSQTVVEAIVERRKALGIKATVAGVKREIREATPLDEADAEDAAVEFVAYLREQSELTDDQPVLRYYRDDFYIYDFNRWVKQDMALLRGRITKFCRRNGSVRPDFISTIVTNLTGLCLLECWDCSAPFLVKCESPLEVEQPRRLVFEDGWVDVGGVVEKEKEKKKWPMLRNTHEPSFFNQVALPFKFGSQTEKCDRWISMLTDVLLSKGEGDRRIDVLQEFMGWTLIQNDLQFEMFLVLVGSGQNGKSTILRTWRSLLGHQNVSNVPLDGINGEFRIHEMEGKLANIGGDMNYINKVAEGVLKQLTSGEAIQVNRKFKDPVTMVPSAKLIFATNTLPPFNDRSNGIWRRVLVLPFFEQIADENVDTQLAAKLEKELPGIFSWALKGAMRLYSQGGFTKCEICDAAREEHRISSDPFEQFVDTEIELDEDYSTPTRTLYRGYELFCRDTGVLPKRDAEFGKQVLAAFPTVKKEREGGGDRRYLYRGLKLLNAPSRERDRDYGRSFMHNPPARPKLQGPSVGDQPSKAVQATSKQSDLLGRA